MAPKMNFVEPSKQTIFDMDTETDEDLTEPLIAK
jgi:hypothetical protein